MKTGVLNIRNPGVFCRSEWKYCNFYLFCVCSSVSWTKLVRSMPNN